MDGFGESKNTVSSNYCFQQRMSLIAEYMHDNVYDFEMSPLLYICNKKEEEGAGGNRRRNQTCHQEQTAGEVQRQTINEESRYILSNQLQPVDFSGEGKKRRSLEGDKTTVTRQANRESESSVRDEMGEGTQEGHLRRDGMFMDSESVRQSSRSQAVEIEGTEDTLRERGAGSSIEIATTKKQNASIQVRINDGVHESHQRKATMIVDLVAQSSLSQVFDETQTQNTFSEGEMDTSSLKGENTAIVQVDSSTQVRIDNGADESHQRSAFKLLQLCSVSALAPTLHSGADCVPRTSLDDNRSIEETTSSWEGTALVTGRQDGGSRKTKVPVHSEFDISDILKNIKLYLFIVNRT